ncbi:hypothetical protein HPB50_018090 [Hyalomma asiaticum]|uniref:Uncharacterized protein n=1 Tax=Hyalomma asiaticum TaxID=266040 RepID=A0ACB7RPA7_HYAAI|nr:hypothetical protein HPB50_018090 [Hyalomma asiaticum]
MTFDVPLKLRYLAREPSFSLKLLLTPLSASYASVTLPDEARTIAITAMTHAPFIRAGPTYHALVKLARHPHNACGNCEPTACPARGRTCFACSRRSQFMQVCRSSHRARRGRRPTHVQEV